MKKIKDTSNFDTQGSLELTKNYQDAIFALKKHLSFDGDRFQVTGSRQTSDTSWEFLVRSADENEEKYSASSHGFVTHIPEVKD